MMSSMSCVLVLAALISPAAGVALSTVNEYAGNATRTRCDVTCCQCVMHTGQNCHCDYKPFHEAPPECKESSEELADMQAEWEACKEKVWQSTWSVREYNAGPADSDLLLKNRDRFPEQFGHWRAKEIRVLRKFKADPLSLSESLDKLKAYEKENNYLRLCGPEPRSKGQQFLLGLCRGNCRRVGIDIHKYHDPTHDDHKERKGTGGRLHLTDVVDWAKADLQRGGHCVPH